MSFADGRATPAPGLSRVALAALALVLLVGAWLGVQAVVRSQHDLRLNRAMARNLALMEAALRTIAPLQDERAAALRVVAGAPAEWNLSLFRGATDRALAELDTLLLEAALPEEAKRAARAELAPLRDRATRAPPQLTRAIAALLRLDRAALAAPTSSGTGKMMALVYSFQLLQEDAAQLHAWLASAGLQGAQVTAPEQLAGAYAQVNAALEQPTRLAFEHALTRVRKFSESETWRQIDTACRRLLAGGTPPEAEATAAAATLVRELRLACAEESAGVATRLRANTAAVQRQAVFAILGLLVLAACGVAAALGVGRLQRELRERRRLQREVEQARDSLAQFRRALDLSAIVAVTDRAGVIVDVNDRFCTSTGYRREEVLGHTHRLIKSTRHPPEFFRALWETIAAGRIWSGEICNLTKAGEETFFDTMIVPIAGPDGRPVQFIALRHDVTERKRLALELERLALLAQKTTVAMFIVDPTGRIEWANPAFEQLTGYELPALIGRSPALLLHGPETDPTTVAQMEAGLVDGGGFEVEVVNYRRDATPFWVHVKTDPVRGPDGRTQRFVVVATDITARRRSESLAAGILETAAHALIATDPQGTIEVFNRGAEQLLGHPAAEIVGRATPLLFLEPDELAQRADRLAAELARPVPPTFEAVTARAEAMRCADECETTFIRQDGNRVPVRLVTTAMRDRAGRVTGFLLLASDITVQRESIEQLRRSEERWQLAISGSNDGAWEWDIRTDRMWVSPRDREILGLAELEETISRAQWIGLMHPDDAEGAREAVRRYFAGETTVYEYTYRVRESGGTWRWVLTRGKAVFDAAGRPLRMLGTHTDVTASRQLQDRLRESEARLLEAQAVAHIGNWSLDAATRVLGWSEETARIFGLSFRTSSLGAALRLCPAPARSALRAALGLALARGESTQFDVAMGEARPQALWVRITIRAAAPEGRVVRVFGTVQDITALHEAEARRREAAQRLEKIASQVPGMVFQFVLRPDGAVTMPYASAGAATLFGLAPERLAEDARPVLAAIDPADLEMVRASIRDSAAQLTTWVSEFRVRQPDGTVRWLFGNAQPERLGDGGVLWHGFITEVTARKRVEARLREQEMFLKELFSGIDLPLWVIDVLEDGRFRFAGVNSSFERNAGLAAAAIIGRSPCELTASLPVEMGRQLEDHLHDCVLAGTTINYEELIHVGGRERWWLTQLKPVRDEDGRISRLIGSAIEITERMEMEQRLRESEERFFLIARATSDAVWDYDPAAGSLWWSDGVTRLFGYEQPGSLAGLRWWFARVHPEDRALVEDGFAAALESVAERWECEYRFLHADGRCLYVFDRALILRGSGGRAIRVVGGMTDVTEQRAVRDAMRVAREAAEAANARLQESVQRANTLAREAAAATVAKSEFLANMSHEIRTPLNAIIGMGGLILGTELTEQQREFVETIRISGDTLLSLINDILDFSKIESGSLELEAVPFGLHDCVEAALDFLGPRAGEKRLDLVYWIEPAAPTAVVGDVTRVRQVLVNLVGNAVKFTRAGEVYVGVERIGLEDGAVRLRFTVRDTGIGIPPERMDRLFKSFSQVDASTTRKFGGTGLGLAISRRLVELMDGRIWAESEVGHGSRFIFEIRLGIGSGTEALNFARPIEALAGRRVLVVEDNATVREVIARHLAGWGLSPRTLASGGEALEWLRREGADLLVLDQQLPGHEGTELLRRLRDLPNGVGRPALLLSSLEAFGQLPADLGSVAQLAKPLKCGFLREAVVHAFGVRGRAVAVAPTRVASVRKLAEEHPLSILLAEDNVTNQRVAQLILNRLGYRADIANNGVEALAALERQHYDVVFLDVQMPEMDGLTAAKEINRRLPRTALPRLIAMTANAMVGDRDECLAAGMHDYVAKPVQAAELEAALRRASEQRAKPD
ncbi:MAG: PAS domain S-box protein [Opitutaceae bacterium]